MQEVQDHQDDHNNDQNMDPPAGLREAWADPPAEKAEQP
jgi:hypothetical protein